MNKKELTENALVSYGNALNKMSGIINTILKETTVSETFKSAKNDYEVNLLEAMYPSVGGTANPFGSDLGQSTRDDLGIAHNAGVGPSKPVVKSASFQAERDVMNSAKRLRDLAIVAKKNAGRMTNLNLVNMNSAEMILQDIARTIGDARKEEVELEKRVEETPEALSDHTQASVASVKRELTSLYGAVVHRLVRFNNYIKNTVSELHALIPAGRLRVGSDAEGQRIDASAQPMPMQSAGENLSGFAGMGGGHMRSSAIGRK